jgi:hypothetical protein
MLYVVCPGLRPIDPFLGFFKVILDREETYWEFVPETI